MNLLRRPSEPAGAVIQGTHPKLIRLTRRSALACLKQVSGTQTMLIGTPSPRSDLKIWLSDRWGSSQLDIVQIGFPIMATARNLEPMRPFLRWAGGKRWLLPLIHEITGGIKYERYFEPFAGAASVFFGLVPCVSTHLSDSNRELIETYQTVTRSPEAVAEQIATHENSEDYYYELRASRARGHIQRAARFIFLNHTSFNGVYRVNLKGEYNVPYGFRRRPNIPSRTHLVAAAKRLATCTISSSDFADFEHDVCRDDLYFLDPPYTVAHDANGFLKYNQRIFSFEDQERLKSFIDTVRSRRAYYILTNAHHASIIQLFGQRDVVIETHRKNLVGGLHAIRGHANEVLITNLGK